MNVFAIYNYKKLRVHAFYIYDDYLEKLQMHILFEKLSDENVERFVQLTNKSNQFNLRTVRYTEAEVNQLSKNEDFHTFSFTLSDKFGDNGLICVIILSKAIFIYTFQYL